MVRRVVLWRSGMRECRRVAALSSILVSEPGARLLGCLVAVVCCRHGACRSDRLRNRRRPCQVLCRCRSFVWVASFFCRLLYLRCSRSRTLIVHCGILFHYERSLLRPPSCWLVLTAVRVFGLSSVQAAP